MTRSMIVGQGGRESVLGSRMAANSALYAFMRHENPSLAHYSRESGGRYECGDVTDPAKVAAFARRHRIEIAMVSSDAPLAAGVVDALHELGVQTVGPTRSGAQIEWDKAFSREIVEAVAPECNPWHFMVRGDAELKEAFDVFGDRDIVVKPTGLTGGKGVKVMGPHLKDHAEALAYAKDLMSGESGAGGVILEERIHGIEFTIQAITDGENICFPPPTYDYPYRYDGDTGPGTGGMGSFASEATSLPFVSNAHYESAKRIIRLVIAELRRRGRHFNGVLNSGFFATDDGVRVIEFNARFGDPEAMNIVRLLQPSNNWIETMGRLSSGSLTDGDIEFQRKSSVVVYLVAPEYAVAKPCPRLFTLDSSTAYNDDAEADTLVFFASSQATGRPDEYRTVGASRVLAFSSLGDTLEDARQNAYGAIEESGLSEQLDFRRDIGSKQYIEWLRSQVRS